MTLRARGFTAECDSCQKLLEVPGITEDEAWDLLNRHGWHRVDLDGVETDLCKYDIAKKLQERIAKGLGPLVYLR